MKRFCAIVLILAGSQLWMSGQVPRQPIRILTPDDGLPVAGVLDVMQDRQGYLWLATYGGGAARYDGNRFEIFTEKQGLANSIVQALYQDDAGIIWLGTSTGLSRYNGKTFRSFSFAPGQGAASIWDILWDPRYGLLIATDSGVYRLAGDRFEKVGAFPLPAPPAVKCLFLDRQQRLWAGTEAAGLFRLENDAFQAVTIAGLAIPGTVNSMLEARDQSRWFATDQGLFQEKSGRINRWEVRNGLADNMVHSLCQDSQDRIWIATRNGLSRLDENRMETWRIPQGLSSNWVCCLQEDREGNLWAGTYNGLSQFKNQPFTYLTPSEGLIDPMTWSIYKDRQGDFWVGSAIGLTRYHQQQILHYSQKDGLAGDWVVGVREDDRGQLWVCSANGAASFNGRDFQPLLSPRPSQVFYDFSQDARGHYWFGTNDGVMQWDGKAFRFHQLSPEPGSHKTIRVLRDRQGNLWFGARNGLVRYDGKSFHTYTVKDGLNSNRIETLAEDENGIIWIGTLDKGINTFDGQRFESFTNQDGLLDDVVVSLLPDRQGRVWIGTNLGLDCFDYAAFRKEGRKTFRHYQKAEGFWGVECNGNAAYRDAEGLLYFGTVKGVMILKPQDGSFNTREPATHLTGVRLFLQPFLADAALENHPPAAPLAWNQNHLTFDFLGISLTVPEKVRYRYQLEGLDPDWSPVTTDRHATYTNLPSGKFTFRVMACNEAGIWNKTGVAVPFEIATPFWKALWFQISLLLVLMATLLGVHKTRTRALRRRQEELEQVVTQRTQQLQEAYRELETLSNTDALTGLYNRRFFQEKVLKDIALAVRKNARKSDLRMINSLGFLMLDLDYFKQVNDTAGHDAGDRLLKEVSRRMLDTIRSSDTLVRWGGEEFLLLSQENEAQDARALAERLRVAINGKPFEVGGQWMTKTISLGFCPFPLFPDQPGLLSWEETVQLADMALYLSKQTGRNRWTGIAALASQLTPEQLQLLKTDLRQATEQRLIRLLTMDSRG